MKAKQATLTFAVLLFATLLLAACGPECPDCIEETGSSVQPALCVGFREYGPGQTFSNPYEQQGITFIIESDLPEFETVSLNNLSGLAIEGILRVFFSIDTDKVWIQSAVPKSATAVSVTVLNGNKDTLHQAIIPNDATLHQITITRDASDIQVVSFSGGGGEALLIEVCINE